MVNRNTAPSSLPVIFTAAEAKAAGLTRDQIRQRVRSGDWSALARGIYTRCSVDPASADRQHHLYRAIATALAHPDKAIGYESAAIVHGLPLHQPIPLHITLCVAPGQWTGWRSGVRFRQSTLPSGSTSEHVIPHLTSTPISIVTAACAWIQVTSSGSFAAGLVSGDAGLRMGAFTRDDLSRVIASVRPIRGRRVIELALSHLNPLRESPLESQSWAYLIRNRLPLPELQVEIIDEWGDFIARVDLLWRNERVIGEIDGRIKYTKPEDVYREKRREDRLRAMGFDVIRWGAIDLQSRALAKRIEQTLDRRRDTTRRAPSRPAPPGSRLRQVS